ncbi:histidine kinase [Olivibacter sp. SA151]|uniref:histidine kinase n=1 Tax=Olivibacter jilunii TaxID=985016 RepID=UPI003F186645
MLTHWYERSQHVWVHVLVWLVYIAYHVGLFSLFEDELDYWENYVSYFSMNILFFYLHGRYVIPRILRLKGWNALKIPFISFAEFAAYCLVYALISSLFGDMYWDFSTFLPLFEVANATPFLQPFLAFLFVSSLYGFLRLFGYNLLLQDGRITISSHFLNNFLSAIYSSVAKEQKAEAQELIVWLQEHGGIIVDKEYHRPQPLEAELEALKNFIAMKRAASGSFFFFNLTIGEGVASFELAPLMLLTVAENMFHHGLVTVEDYPACLSITLTDASLVVHAKNGINRAARHKGCQIGLTNVRTRLKLHHRGKHQLIIKESKEVFELYLRVWE